MRRRKFLAGAAAVGAAFPLSARAQVEAFRPLFNGRDLSGWVPVGPKPGEWRAEEGILSVQAGGSGWLRTEREYRDFVLRLKFRLPPAGNSGVFLRAPLAGNPAFDGLEIQILDHFHEEYRGIKPAQFTGSIYDLVPARQEGLLPAGQWNAFEITHRGDALTVALNGLKIVEADLTRLRRRIEDHPGIGRKEGFIGLQSHGSVVQFRDLLIRELP